MPVTRAAYRRNRTRGLAEEGGPMGVTEVSHGAVMTALFPMWPQSLLSVL